PFGRRPLGLADRSKTVPRPLRLSRIQARSHGVAARAAISALLITGLVNESRANSGEKDQQTEGRLRRTSLEDLGQIEVTTASKEPVKASRIPAAIYVITQEDIQRSGATSVPEVLRQAPGVEVAQVDSNTWSLGIRG